MSGIEAAVRHPRAKVFAEGELPAAGNVTVVAVVGVLFVEFCKI